MCVCVCVCVCVSEMSLKKVQNITHMYLKFLSLYLDPAPCCGLALDSTDRKLVMSG